MKLKDLLDKEPFKSEKDLQKLLKDLNHLKEALDGLTLGEYQRINPFIENVFDWKLKGEKLFGKDKNITIYDTCTLVGNIEIGENTWIGPYSALDGTGGLQIGKYCSISSHVNIVSHDTVKWALTGGKHPYEYAPIVIGDFCFIGTGAMITKGVRIGNRCLIGAGAVVTSDVPDFSIVGGVPGKIIGNILMEENGVDLKFNFNKNRIKRKT